jgi:hypothetical protein
MMTKNIESLTRTDIVMLSDSKVQGEVLRVDNNNVLNNSKGSEKSFIQVFIWWRQLSEWAAAALV